MKNDRDDEDELDKMVNDILNDNSKVQQITLSPENRTKSSSPIKLPTKAPEFSKNNSVMSVSEFNNHLQRDHAFPAKRYSALDNNVSYDDVK